MKGKEEIFGYTSAGDYVKKVTITNEYQVSIQVISYGATWYDWQYVKNGKSHSLVAHLNSVEQYETNPFHLGNTIGRVAGRISNARFDLDGTTYSLPPNEHSHLLHSSSIKGFDCYNWKMDYRLDEDEAHIILEMDTEEDGFPGNMNCRVIYTLNNNNEVTITYEGISDAMTLFDPMTHVYFTFNDGNSLDDVMLSLNGDHVEVNEEKIPTGQLKQCDLQSVEINELLQSWKNHQLDDAFQIPSRKYAVELKSGEVTLRAKTDRNAAILFTANPFCIYHDDEKPFNSIAIELQTLPDAIHHPSFGNIVLSKGKKYRYQNTYQIEVYDE